MNRRERRQFQRQIEKGAAPALLAAQALSREELDQALRNWGGLLGADNAGPFTRSVIVTNRLDKRVTIVASLQVFPAPDVDEARTVIVLNPHASPGELAHLANPLNVSRTPYRVLHSPSVPKLGGMVLKLEELTPDQQAALEAMIEEEPDGG